MCDARRSPFSCAALITLSGLLLLICGCLRIRHSSQFLVPNGYVGWVDVSYGVRGAPPLPVESGYYAIHVSPNGKAQTSTEIEGGRAGDQFYAVKSDHRTPLSPSGAGGGGMIWGDSVTGKSRGATREFFVGTEGAFRKSHPP